MLFSLTKFHEATSIKKLSTENVVMYILSLSTLQFPVEISVNLSKERVEKSSNIAEQS